MLWHPDDIRVSEAVQQLADRLAFAGSFDPAAELLRDEAAYAEVDPSACRPLPEVSVFWGLDGTPPLVSLLLPQTQPDHESVARIWNGAVRCGLLGKKTTSLTKAFALSSPEVTDWLERLTGLTPNQMRERPTAVLLAISGYYVNDAWNYVNDGIEFCSPLNSVVVQVRGDVVTSFKGQRLPTDQWHGVPIQAHDLPRLAAVGKGSTIRALLEQALFVDDEHTLRIAHLLETSGASLRYIADKLSLCRPRPPQTTPRESYETRPSRAYKTLREVLGIGFDVAPAALADQIDPTLLGDKVPQSVCVAALYRHVVEKNRLMTTGRFVDYVGRNVPLVEWLDEVQVPTRTLIRWLGRFV